MNKPVKYARARSYYTPIKIEEYENSDYEDFSGEADDIGCDIDFIDPQNLGEMKDKKKIVSISPGDCLEELPCTHPKVVVTFEDGSKEVRDLDGLEVARLYLQHLKKVPRHFKCYVLS